MLRLWVDSYRASTGSRTGVAMSVAIHALLIAASVEATRAPEGVTPQHALANRIYYIPPPDRAPSQERVVERIQFLSLGVSASGMRFVDAPTGEHVGGTPSDVAGDVRGLDSINAPELPQIRGLGDVYTEIEVDYQVERDPLSAAPAYPQALLQQGVEGSTQVRYVVDTTGQADVASLVVLRTTHPAFAAAVREALPGMRFASARVGAQKVRQLVEQEFSFRIDTLLLRAKNALAGAGTKMLPDSLPH